VKKHFIDKLAVAWRHAELAGCKSPNEESWQNIKDEMIQKSIGDMDWPYITLLNQDKVKNIFTEVCKELRL